MSKKTDILCPAQKAALDGLIGAIPLGSIFHFWGGVGRGKTTVLKEVHKQTGGAFLTMRDFAEASSRNHPLALEETLYNLIAASLKTHSTVILDDAHLV